MEVAIKISGWLLLTLGVLLIGWTLYSSYNIFTGKAAVPEVFKIEIEEKTETVQDKIPTTPEEIQKEMERSLKDPLSSLASPLPEEEVQQIIEKQLKEVLPVDLLPGMLNLTAWSILAFILIFGGGQLSGLGIKLIKK